MDSTLSSLAISSLVTVKLLPVARGQTGPRALQRSMNARGSPLVASSSSGSRKIRGMVSSAQKTIMTERGRSVSHKRRAVLVRSCRSSRAPLWVSDSSKHTLKLSACRVSCPVCGARVARGPSSATLPYSASRVHGRTRCCPGPKQLSSGRRGRLAPSTALDSLASVVVGGRGRYPLPAAGGGNRCAHPAG